MVAMIPRILIAIGTGLTINSVNVVGANKSRIVNTLKTKNPKVIKPTVNRTRRVIGDREVNQFLSFCILYPIYL
jgi:hypothetical protein